MEGFAYIPDPGDGPKLAGRNAGVVAEEAGKVRLGGKAELIGHLAETHIAIDCAENGLFQSHNIQKDARAYAGRGFEHTEEIGAARQPGCRVDPPKQGARTRQSRAIRACHHHAAINAMIYMRNTKIRTAKSPDYLGNTGQKLAPTAHDRPTPRQCRGI